MTSLAALEPTLIVVAILVLVVARRTYANLHGAYYSADRLFAYAGFAAAFFVLFAASTLYPALGTWGPTAWALLAPYAAVPAVVAWQTAPHVQRVVRFERRGDGRTYYQLPWLVPVLYLVLFAARLAIEVVLFGASGAFAVTFPTSLPASTLAVLVAFDLLYAASVGLLLGRSFGIRAAYRAAPVAEPPASAPTAPPPLA